MLDDFLMVVKGHRKLIGTAAIVASGIFMFVMGGQANFMGWCAYWALAVSWLVLVIT
jgi:hypothetical protein